MSDNDDFMMDEGGDEEYDFDYEDDDQEDVDTDMENKYYQAKNYKTDNPEKALADWRSIVETENPKGEWGFKALKQSTKLNFHRGNYQEALKTYTELLDYCQSAVTRNAAEKAINGILDYVGAAQDLDTSLMQQWYEVTQNALQAAKNDRLNVKIELKLAKIWMDKKEYARLEHVTQKLRMAIKAPNSASSSSNLKTESFDGDNCIGTLLLEVFAIEIQMYTDRKEHKKLREIYDQTLTVKSTIPHPKIMGIIRECGGKMHMSEKNWTAAQYDFFEAFKNYDEAGSPQRISSLKYLVLAHMLMNSGIDPFDSQETKPYKQDPQIVAMTNLVAAYQRQDVHEAERIIKNNRSTILEDPFIANYIQDVLTSLRTQWILGILQSYNKIEIAHIARQLKVSDSEVEEIMLLLILDKKISGKLDQVNGVLELDEHSEIRDHHYKSLERWNSELNKLHSNLMQKTGFNFNTYNSNHQFNHTHPFYG
ncbi:hypothetical protein PCANC_08888 [Puccinia coronata f. sp. avenae]|uniref:COP9 signalosome complex subunit 2 n=1 Tax=Puccinia coronata f. sp. avenae TaxID=200324 RepID=A0A2N5VS59_9BASI|nr:hypothetical protein PCASD_25473 [Puccinia coronata f. sp. avenae]PLW18444.1 hypothetical protein PCANC_15796 [Puccinia coronata f. sp. avenae]PLW52825.1 hypothetical protein PCANC_08888 [Puccinia coronata f. sp. avenae]